MRLENILALTNGRLINDPFVKIFENIVFEASEVKRGDLFIAFEYSMIEEAILNGAYGIIFDKPTQISDMEIAWIKVKECKEALKRLLRFRLIEKDIKVYECNEIILKLSLQVITDSNFIPIQGDIKEIHKQLWNVEPQSIILFCPQMCDFDMFTNILCLPNVESAKIVIMEETLFETSFIYNDIFYERQLISPFFIPYLEKLLALYKALQINFRIRRFTQIDHFEAVFVSKKLEIKEFGISDKVLIFESNTHLIKNQISFLKANASWGNLIYIIPDSIECEETQNIFKYESPDQIKNILQNNNFNFALIVGADKSFLTQPITNKAQLIMEF